MSRTRSQKNPLTAVIPAVYAEAHDGPTRATAFQRAHPSFADKTVSLLHRLSKRRCGDVACLCGPPFTSQEGCDALLADAFAGDDPSVAVTAIAALEFAVDQAIGRLARNFTCEACRATRSRGARISVRRKRSATYSC
jgi:hypothetical protein